MEELEELFKEFYLTCYDEGSIDYIPFEYLKNDLYPDMVCGFDGELTECDIDCLQISYSDDMSGMDQVLADELSDQIDTILECLNEREKTVIKLRFGLTEDKTDWTLEEIGKELRITRERVRSIESFAIKKLQRPKYGRKLKNYIEEKCDFSNPLVVEIPEEVETIKEPKVVNLDEVIDVNDLCMNNSGSMFFGY